MIPYFPRGELSYVILKYSREGKISKRFSLENDFMDQIFTGEISGVDSVELQRQSVLSPPPPPPSPEKTNHEYGSDRIFSVFVELESLQLESLPTRKILKIVVI